MANPVYKQRLHESELTTFQCIFKYFQILVYNETKMVNILITHLKLMSTNINMKTGKEHTPYKLLELSYPFRLL